MRPWVGCVVAPLQVCVPSIGPNTVRDCVFADGTCVDLPLLHDLASGLSGRRSYCHFLLRYGALLEVCWYLLLSSVEEIVRCAVGTAEEGVGTLFLLRKGKTAFSDSSAGCWSTVSRWRQITLNTFWAEGGIETMFLFKTRFKSAVELHCLIPTGCWSTASR